MPTTIDQLVSALERIAPTTAAEGWDNVGLLLAGTRPVRTVGVTIDLAPEVWAELSDCDAIIAYHPPIFKGLKRLVGRTPRERTLLAVIRAGVHVYAPHTALDAAVDGMGDWLLAAVAPTDLHLDARPVQPTAANSTVGVGRRAELSEPRTARELLPRIKDQLGLSHVRVAGDLDRACRSVAVCPGSGGSVLGGLSDVDLLLTGEMGHHEVLSHVAAGGVVVLTDHTNCERGYLPHYAARIQAVLPGVEVRVSVADHDPLRVV